MNLKVIFALQMLLALGLFSTNAHGHLTEENKSSLINLIQTILLDPEYMVLSDTEKLVVLDAVIMLMKDLSKQNSDKMR
jgi:uncharacterized membrane protein